MFNGKKIKALEKRVAALEGKAQEQPDEKRRPNPIDWSPRDPYKAAADRVLSKCQSASELSHS